MKRTEAAAAPGGFWQRVGELFPFDWELVKHAGAEPVPYHLKKWWFCLGGTPMYLFLVQVGTGILLTLYYVPSVGEAYESVTAISESVRFGWFIRSLHKWSSNFMIVAVILHMLRVFFTRAYRYPRQLNWMVGFLLLGLTMMFGFTGYSLVYEQLSYWGATVATNLAESVPLIGPWVAHFLRGGPEIGEATLTRLFILHIGILPTLALFLLGMHVVLIRMHGVTELKFEDEKITERDRFFRFWPDHVTTELILGVLLMYVLTILALIFPAEMGAKADPTVTPEHIKPEWYFYFQFRLLKLTSLKLSLALTGLLGAVAFFWPFVDGWLQKRTKHTDRIVVVVGGVAFIGYLVLTLWEVYSF